MAKTKRCPFCGGKAYVHQNWSDRFETYFVFVKCDVCGGQGGITSDPEPPSRYGWKTDSVDRAVAKWNNRVQEESDG